MYLWLYLFSVLISPHDRLVERIMALLRAVLLFFFFDVVFVCRAIKTPIWNAFGKLFSGGKQYWVRTPAMTGNELGSGSRIWHNSSAEILMDKKNVLFSMSLLGDGQDGAGGVRLHGRGPDHLLQTHCGQQGGRGRHLCYVSKNTFLFYTKNVTSVA